jgi:hypothetical protein
VSRAVNIIWHVEEVGLFADVGKHGGRTRRAGVFRRGIKWCGIIDADVGGWEQRQGYWPTRAAAVRAIENALRGGTA